MIVLAMGANTCTYRCLGPAAPLLALLSRFPYRIYVIKFSLVWFIFVLIIVTAMNSRRIIIAQLRCSRRIIITQLRCSSQIIITQLKCAGRRTVSRRYLFCSVNPEQQRHNVGVVSFDGAFEGGHAVTAGRRVKIINKSKT